MDGLKVLWTKTAKAQRDHIFDYWNKRNKSNCYSQKLNLLIRKKTKLLKAQPEMGRKTNFNKIRTVSMGHYRIFYKIKADVSQLIIMGFWDNRQDPKKLLNFLKGKKRS